MFKRARFGIVARVLLIILVISMMFPMVPVQAEIADGSTGESNVESLAEEDTTTGESDVDALHLNKTVEADPSDTDKFTLTLEAFSTGEEIRVYKDKPADIVLVFDQSSTMYTPLQWTKDRLVDDESQLINATLKEYAITDFVTTARAEEAAVQADDTYQSEFLENAKRLGYYVAVHNSANFIYLVQYAQDKSGNWGWYYVVVDQTTRSIDSVDTESIIEASDYYFENGENHGTVVWINEDRVGNQRDLLSNVTYYKSQYGELCESATGFIEDLKDSGVNHRVGIVGFSSPFYDGWDHYDGTGLYIDGNFYLYDTDFMYKGWQLEDGTYTYEQDALADESKWTGDVYLDPNAAFAETDKDIKPLAQDVLTNAYKNSIICKDENGEPTGPNMYGEAMVSLGDEGAYESLEKSLNAVTANYQQTCPGAGIQIAQNIFEANKTTDGREQIIILYTDGVPTVRIDTNRHHGWSKDGQVKAKYWSITGGVENAYEVAGTAKKSGIDIYTIGTAAMKGEGIDYAYDMNGDSLNAGEFLTYLSSNYSGISAEGEYLSDTNGNLLYQIKVARGTKDEDTYAQFAGTRPQLDAAFGIIYDYLTIPIVDLDEYAVLNEVLTEYFKLQNNDITDITVYTALYKGVEGNGNEDLESYKNPNNYEERKELEGASVKLIDSDTGLTSDDTIPADTPVRFDTIEVRGYDYKEEFVSNMARQKEDENGNVIEGEYYYGSKLIVEVKIEARDGFWGGNNVPTNKDTTAIYEKNTEIKKFPMPEVHVPRTPEIVTESIVIYYGGEVTARDLVRRVVIDGVDVVIGDGDSLTPAENWMDDYADLTWNTGSFDSPGTTAINNKRFGLYTYAVTLTPEHDGTANLSPNPSNMAGTLMEVPASGFSGTPKTASVKILVPIVTFEDSTIGMGVEVDDSYHDAVNLVKGEDGKVLVKWVEAEWRNEEAATYPETEPTLDFTYEAVKETDDNGNDITFLVDTKMNVKVSSDNVDGQNADITNVTTFEWKDCDEPLHDDETQLPIESHMGNVDLHEFWIHRVNYAVPDTVVIDYGLPVDIDVLTNDTKIDGTTVTLQGIGASQTETKPELYDANYGSANIVEEKVRYTVDTMNMAAPETFYYGVMYDGDEATTGTYYSTITVIPATNIYYEDSVGGDDFMNFIPTTVEGAATGTWSVDGTTSSGTVQAEDRPGEGLDAIDADNVYGYDSAYSEYKEFSLGSAHKVTVDEISGANMNVAPRAKFNFTGTGFDVISLTNNRSGVIAVRVFERNADGSDGAIKKSQFVNTYYGYSYADPDEDGTFDWIVNTESTDGLYQVPVIKVDGLEYGAYNVEIIAAYLPSMDKTGEDGYTIWVDAVRIYNPAKNDETANNAYVKDGEINPVFIEIRNILLGTEQLVEQGSVSGSVFIDGKGIDDIGPEASDYQNKGPNNEVYLTNKQAVAFKLVATEKPLSVQVGAKLVKGKEATLMLNGNALSVLKTATNMFYKLDLKWTQNATSQLWESEIITLSCNASDGTNNIISLTDLKITSSNGIQAPSAAAGTSLDEIISEGDGAVVLAVYDESVSEEAFEVMNNLYPSKGEVAFEDVDENEFYYNPVLWAVGKGITNGLTPTQFAPDKECTRGQVVTFLWRAAGEPKASNAKNPFKDVDENEYYYDAVLWAVEEGITTGCRPDEFVPEMTCTRGQVVTFIWRAADEPVSEADTCAFTDVAEDAYYRDAVLWAVENEITTGSRPDEFEPEIGCTRGQIVTFIYRYYN